MQHPLRLVSSIAIAAGLSAGTAVAEDTMPADTVLDALTGGTTNFDARLRYEAVSNDNPGQDDAGALTLRLKLGYKTGTYQGFHGYLEFEGVEDIAGDYNSGANGKTDYATVLDPDGAEINQGYLGYSNEEINLSSKLGRQIIAWDNQRHIGHVGWRQNWQTFDAATLEHKGVEDLTLKLAYLWNVNTIRGTNAPMTTILANGNYKVGEFGNAAVYLHYMDYTYGASDGLDHLTFGAFFDGDYAMNEQSKLLYRLELASQGDAADNPTSYSAMYAHAMLGYSFKPLTLQVGYELLGSDDGDAAFKVPLGTNHKFNGWSDVLLGGAGNDGLQDIYASLGFTIPAAPGLSGSLVYHNFTGDESGDDIGNEFDVVLTYKQPSIKKMVYGLKAALFSADDDYGKVDTEKFWAWVQWGF